MQELLQKIIMSGEEIYAKICKVISVDTDNMTVDLRPLDGSSDILDAFFQVDKKGIKVEPKVDSLVTCVFINKETAVIVNHSELKQFQIKIENVEFQLDKNGFLIKKEKETLKKIIQDFLKAIKAMKFSTNQGPTINLLNIADFRAIEKRINNFFKP